MRRNLAPVLIGLGAFLLVAGVMVRFYAYPRLAVAPVDIDSTTRLEAKGATIFNSDPKVLAEMQTDLEVVSVTRGDVGATEKAKDGTLVWVQTTRVTSADGVDRSLSTEQAAHDEVSGAAVGAAAGVNWVEVPFDTTPGEEPEIRRVAVDRTGQIFKFPFGTEKKTYKYWDGDIEKAPDATYKGEDEIDGLTVYKFVQSIPATKIGTRAVPASVFGLQGDAVEADSMYANERTLWVEPQTGAIIDRSEKQLSTVEYDGHVIRTTDATFEYTDKQVASNVEKASKKATLLGLASGAGWITLAVLGLLVLAGGVLLHRRRA